MPLTIPSLRTDIEEKGLGETRVSRGLPFEAWVTKERQSYLMQHHKPISYVKIKVKPFKTTPVNALKPTTSIASMA